MKLFQRSRPAIYAVLLAFLLLAGPATPAQEEAGEEETGHAMFYGAEAWVAQPGGLEYSPATEGDEFVRYDYSTESELRQIVGFNFPNNFGQISLTYFNHGDQDELSQSSPGNFIFGEHMTNPLYSGYDDFGAADAFDSSSATRLRDWHLDFSRPAFQTPRVSGTWSLGWRRVTHDRELYGTYFALVPDQPPTNLPPVGDCSPNCPDLSPLVDTASILSSFEGRGVNLGFDLDFHLWKDKIVLEGGLAVSVLRGKMDSSYDSLVSRYWDSHNEAVVGPPFSEFSQCRDIPFPVSGGCTGVNGPPLINFIEQQTIGTTLNAEGVSATSTVLDGQLGFRWIVTNYLDLVLGFRQTSYDDVGVDRRGFGNELGEVPPGTIGVGADFTVRVLQVSEERRSAVYEGFYVGARFSFF